MKILKYILVLLAFAFSVSSAVGLAENASKFVGNITTNGQVRSDLDSTGTKSQLKTNVSGRLLKAPADVITSLAVRTLTTGQSRIMDTSSSTHCFGVLNIRAGLKD